MNRLLLSAALASILAAGCGHAGLDVSARTSHRQHTSQNTPREASRDAAPDAGRVPANAPAKTTPAPEIAAAARQPGDYVAYRFSGSFRKAPLLLTQRVVAREGDVLVVDLTLEDDREAEVLRVRMSDAPSTRGEILGASWMQDGVERPATLAAYDAMMAKTTLAADENEAVLGSEPTRVEVSGESIPCQRTSYRVRIGRTKATMHTLQSDQFVWGDVGGEITSEDGRVLYRAELVQKGHAAPGEQAASEASAAAEPRSTMLPTTVARSDYDD